MAVLKVLAVSEMQVEQRLGCAKLRQTLVFARHNTQVARFATVDHYFALAQKHG
jgi:hypothetical protein